MSEKMSTDSAQDMQKRNVFKRLADILTPIRTAKTKKETKQKRGWSRRRFLLASGTLIAEELFLGGISKIVLEPGENALREAGILVEGNVAQFMLVLRKLISEYVKNPSTENSQSLAAWLKFNAAAQYANHSHKEIAGTLAFHFLYGEGKSLDIRALFSQQIPGLFNELFTEQQRAQLGVTESTSNEEKINILFEQMLAEKPVASSTRHYVWVGQEGVSEAEHPDEENVSTGVYTRIMKDDNNDFTFVVGTPSAELNNRRVRIFGVANLTTENNLYGMAQFTAAAEGKVISANSGQSLTLDQCKIYLVDEYDWHAGTGFDAEASIGQIISQLGLDELFQGEIFNDIKNQNMSITDDDGALLTKLGYTHNFEVTASFTPNRPIVVNNSSFERPPTDYLNSVNGKVITN